jgi:starch phosphorylase
MAGKAHPADNAGKGLIRDIFATAAKLESSKLRILYLENYDWDLGEQLTNGVDVWLNTPLRPYEASGTSGMKAALNGVPSLSVLDGWWVEGCAENITGWAIENSEDEAVEAERVYHKLEYSVAPAFADKAQWARIRRHCIAINGTYFNTHRMLGQYVSNAYYPPSASIAASNQVVVDDEARQPVLA